MRFLAMGIVLLALLLHESQKRIVRVTEPARPLFGLLNLPVTYRSTDNVCYKYAINGRNEVCEVRR